MPILRIVSVASLAAAFSLIGCYPTPQTATKVAPANIPTKSFQRFLPVSPAEENRSVPWHAFFALDTQTGQLCRTTILVLNDNYMAGVPTCYSLYREVDQSGRPEQSK